jgi:lipopolysaccharide transport system permease protein
LGKDLPGQLAIHSNARRASSLSALDAYLILKEIHSSSRACGFSKVFPISNRYRFAFQGMKDSSVITIHAGRSSLRDSGRELLRYRDLFFMLTWREISVRYKQMTLGILWVILQPLSSAVIFAFVFGRLASLPSDGMPYLVFAYSGMCIWSLFSQGLSRASDSIIADEKLVSKVYFPRWIIPLAAVTSASVDFAVSLVFLGVLLLFHGIFPGWHFLLLFPAILLTFLFAAALGLIIAGWNVKYRDFRYLTPFLLQLLLFVSPVLYSLSLVPENIGWLPYLNPLAGIFELFRLAITGLGHFSLPGFCLSLLSGVLLAAFSIRSFHRIEEELADFI